ncbi:MAG TPA: HAD-IIA family hydrolase [Streptosporangiaceae bacterium]|nr:HAD-IIA family hydrolase [Streptosporangiaceae bacterium]
MRYETDCAGSPPQLPHQPPPAQEYDVALLDLDGVVYTGQGAVRHAVPALTRAREAGQRLAFVTNNASRSPSAVAAHLTRLGVPATAADVVTSAQAAATLIAERLPPGSPVLVVGAMGLRLALRARGLRPVSVASERPLAVVQGYAPDLSYGLLAEGGLAVRAGALFVGANADLTLPSPHGLQPGNGSMLQVIATATGVQPIVAGKPEPPLHAEAVGRTGAKRPLVVGDRLDTDIEGATRGGADSMLVLTGVSTPRELVLASPPQRPTYVSADLRGLLDSQPAVGPRRGEDPAERGTEVACCAIDHGGWTARRQTADNRIELTGDGEPIDGLRALCALAWSGPQITADQADPALKVLADRL